MTFGNSSDDIWNSWNAGVRQMKNLFLMTWDQVIICQTELKNKNHLIKYEMITKHVQNIRTVATNCVIKENGKAWYL